MMFGRRQVESEEYAKLSKALVDVDRVLQSVISRLERLEMDLRSTRARLYKQDAQEEEEPPRKMGKALNPLNPFA